jgi:hypothetical protein
MVSPHRGPRQDVWRAFVKGIDDRLYLGLNILVHHGNSEIATRLNEPEERGTDRTEVEEIRAV